MPQLSYREAVRQALREAVTSDDRVFLMGEDVGLYGGAYACSKGLLEEFGPERIRDTPLSESCFVGAGIGAALAGMRPIVEIMTINFALLALDQIVNNAATLRHMSGGQVSVPLVIRMATGAGRQVAAQHSHSLEVWFAHVPGLKVLAPATPQDARWMLPAALADPDPVVIVEHALLYSREDEVADSADGFDAWRAAVRREGSDVSLITSGGSLGKCLDAAEALAAHGMEAEVVDLRCLRPLDVTAIVTTVAKTQRAVIVDEGWQAYGLAAEISAVIGERLFGELTAPVARVCTAEVPIPYAKHLEDAALPSVERIIAACRPRHSTNRSRDVPKKPGAQATGPSETRTPGAQATGQNEARNSGAQATVPGEARKPGAQATGPDLRDSRDSTPPVHTFTMPALGADMDAGTLVTWRKQPGDNVSRGDVIAEVDTDKGVIDVEVFTEGVLDQILVEPNTRVPVGTPLARIRERAECGAGLGVSPESPRATPSPSHLPETPVPTPPSAPSPAAAPADRLDRMRHAIAAAMTRSKREIPHYYLSTTIDLQRVTAWLDHENESRPPERRLLPGVLLLKAAAMALRKVPELNAVWHHDALQPRPDIHVGLTISLRTGGLVILAIHDTPSRGLDDLMATVRDLTERARAGRIKSSELADSTITVTNLGDRGVEEVFGVIYPPQVALVGFGRILERPWAADSGLSVRPVVRATLSADHRASDGHRGGLYLEAIDALLQEPEKL